MKGYVIEEDRLSEVEKENKKKQLLRDYKKWLKEIIKEGSKWEEE